MPDGVSTVANPLTSADAKGWVAAKGSTADVCVGQPLFTSSQPLLVFRMMIAPTTLQDTPVITILLTSAALARSWLVLRFQ